ncbi:MAG: sigma 54-interacting transcriptional regulator [Myxococcota bacterium]|nr:sigma 54-interacting transcriptional regulator [Myxococcota bacterium]
MSARSKQDPGQVLVTRAETGVYRSERAGRRSEDRIVGASEATRQLIAQATAAARTELPVILLGPRGSDRELVARAIHAWSSRSADLEVLSCAAIPEALQSRELFGCAEGVYPAVPGAYQGALERSAGTTLLIEDFDALRSGVATALWEAVREGSYRREGEDNARTLSARVICTGDLSTTLSPGDGVSHHRIEITPLDTRREDVLPLAAHYLRTFSGETEEGPRGFTADARAFLESEPWPGDVKELRERIRGAVRLAGADVISAEALMLARDSEEVPSFKEAKRAFETRYVTGLLRRCGGNISRAARLAKKDRKDFYDVVRRTGVDPSVFRGLPQEPQSGRASDSYAVIRATPVDVRVHASGDAADLDALDQALQAFLDSLDIVPEESVPGIGSTGSDEVSPTGASSPSSVQ